MEHNHSDVNRNWKQFGYMRIVNRNYIRKKHFQGNILYFLGYWWANIWLVLFNGLRGVLNTKKRDEFIGNLEGFIKKANIS